MSVKDLPTTGRSTVIEPRQPAAAGGSVRPFAFAEDPRHWRGVPWERTPLGAKVFPQDLNQLRTMLERIGFMLKPADDDVVAPPSDDSDEIRRDHVAASWSSWQVERASMEPLLCQWLWNTMWTWVAMKPGKAVRVDMVAILVDQPHEVTGRVQVSARMRISTRHDVGAVPKPIGKIGGPMVE